MRLNMRRKAVHGPAEMGGLPGMTIQQTLALRAASSSQTSAGRYPVLTASFICSIIIDDDIVVGDEYTNLYNLCFLLFLFIYSSLSISFSFLHYLTIPLL